MGRNNLRTVISFEVGRTLGKRKFWFITLLVPIAIGIVIVLVSLGNSTAASTSDARSDAKLTFTYSDASGYVDPAVATALGGTIVTDEVAAIAAVKSGDEDAHFVYPADPAKTPTQVYGVDKGLFGNGEYDAVATQVLITSAQDQIGDPALTALAQGNVSVTSTTFTDGEETAGFMGMIPPLIFVGIFFLVFMLLSNQMLTSTLEEKENRVTEMILTTLNPTALISGKIMSLFIVGFVQVLVFLVPVLVAYVFFRTSLNLPVIDLSSFTFDPVQMIVGALLAVGGFALFTGTLVAIGAVMPTAKDAGSWFSALIVLMIVPLYSLSLVLSDPNSPVVQVFTYFPYSAPITAMLRNAFGSLAGWEAAIVITELFLLSAIVLQLAVRLFRYGSIEYTNKVSFKTALSRPKTTSTARR
ncbi:ABC transporter permease [Cryobacterium melibiosiphilum]|uniref:ABC transporter permease n=1 Tax=Cryobacterium melibiosiphilum TaxID=995039 RepID=A0A3A5N4H8_9MICO|nr:ABC transporter permease [Cryobacterium melibiosiphilum]RJT92164.1 ABC transporter permease [Cryobacterium melibiosiphilum]